MIRVVSIILFLCVSTLTLAQKNRTIDSLQNLLTTVKDSTRVEVLNTLCWKLRNANPQQSLEYGLQAVSLSQKINFKSGLSIAYGYTGVAYRNMGNYSEAFDAYNKGIAIAIEIKDSARIAYGFINIANLLLYQQEADQAMLNLNEALPIALALKDKKIQAYIYLNKGRVLLLQKKYNQAIISLDSAADIRAEIKEIEGLAVCYKYMGDTYLEQQNTIHALNYYNQCVGIATKGNDQDLIADVHNQISKVYLLQKSYNKAADYANQSLDVAKKINAKPRIKNAYLSLAEVAEYKKDYKLLAQYRKYILQYNDSLFNDELNKRIANYHFNTEHLKQQSQLILLEKDQELNKSQLKIQRLVLIGVGILLLLLVLLVVFQLRARARQKQVNTQLNLQKIEIEEKNTELNMINTEVVSQRDELETILERLSEQTTELEQRTHELIAQKKEITDSILYAKRIQHAVLPNEDMLSRYFPDNFIMFRPRNIVSGDFYWVVRKASTLFIAVADCTGHGVPGAFMSILSVSFLNEILAKNLKKLYRSELGPAVILNELRDMVKRSLHQTLSENSSKDGLDIALCVIDTETMNMQYAGAHNPLYLVRNNELQELKADKMPVSIYAKERSFKQVEIKLTESDRIFLFSDGYYDQVGGERNRKFFVSNFKELIQRNAHLPMPEQKNIIEETFDKWKQNYKQVDDVLVMGLKIPNPQYFTPNRFVADDR